jgi:hypothetical protein
MAAANFYIVAKPLQFDQGLKKRHRTTTGQPSFTRSKVETEPEERLWKVCAEAASSLLSVFEWVTFLLLGVLSLGALAYCLSESFHLLNSGGLDDTVRALLTR